MLKHRTKQERGTTIVVVLFIATAIAALAAISAGRVVAASRDQKNLESETQAYNQAYAQLQLALNVVNTSAYDDDDQNVELRDAVAGFFGGTTGGDEEPTGWLADPETVDHGRIRGTDVRVYRGKDYIKRLAKLKGETEQDVDPTDESRSYFVLEAAGRSGDTFRLVSALVRQNEPFSSFVFFQNRHPLGVSGAPRGLIHSNDRIDFYFPDGSYVDSVSAVLGFSYKSGATTDNTALHDANPEATAIQLDSVDFDKLKDKAGLFVGTEGLDAEIQLYDDGRVRVREYTKPRYEEVENSWTGDVFVGYETRTVTVTQQVQVGTEVVQRTREIVTGYETETYTVEVIDYESQEVEGTREIPIYEDQEVELTRQVPVYELQTVTRTRRVRVFVPYDNEAGGGTAVGGGGEGVPGEWVWVDEEYQVEEQVQVGTTTETYTEIQQVQVGTTTEAYTETVQVEVGRHDEERTRQVPIMGTETYEEEVPVYEEQEVEVEQTVPLYEERTYTWTEDVLIPPVLQETHWLDVHDNPGTMFIHGRITKLAGRLNGRLSIVGNEKVRVTGDIQYVDDNGETAMVNGKDYNATYARNDAYTGKSVLGVIARDDIVFSRSMPSAAEINATLLSSDGRVGIDGFGIAEDGTPVKDRYYGMSDEERRVEEAYNATSYSSRDFRKDSLRRLGGVISNDRILETYIKARSDGTSYVDAGFRRGRMRFDYNLLFNPPPSFVEVPRPVVTSIVPVYFVRGEDD